MSSINPDRRTLDEKLADLRTQVRDGLYTEDEAAEIAAKLRRQAAAGGRK